MLSTTRTDWKELLPEFEEKTAAFYAGTLSKGDYKGFSGLYGSYAQRGGEASMLRLRMTGGRVTKEKLKFVADAIRAYQIDLVHFTNCSTIQLHNLNERAVCELLAQALDAGIVTMGGGGDFPRNVTASPLSGVEAGEYFDVLPWAEAAGDYLLGFILAEKMPRKLKVGFSNSPANATHVTFRDLGFAARPDGTFDVYSAGGLGSNPCMGVKVAEGVQPDQILYYIKAMWLTFRAYGDYKNRGRARTRYMQEKLGGPEAYKAAFLEKLQEVYDSGENLTLAVETAGAETGGAAAAQRDGTCRAGISAAANPAGVCSAAAGNETTGEWTVSLRTVTKTGDGTTASDRRILAQKQPGLYAVVWHPLGGKPDPESICRLCDTIADMEDVELRLSPDGGAYIINLTGAEAERVLAAVPDSAQSFFETSVSCIGASICQVGIRDSEQLLADCAAAVRAANLPDGVLPQIHISGCPSSCGTHQIGRLGFRGAAKSVNGKSQPAYLLTVNGSDRQGEECFGREVAVLLETQIPGFLVRLGQTVAAAGVDFETWFAKNPEGIDALVAEFV